MDYSLLVSSVHGILQAGILEWVSMSFSRGSSQPRDRTWLSALGGRLSTIWATREALAVLEFPASLSWETHTTFLPVRPMLLGFGCTQWVNIYWENRILRGVWSLLRWAEMYLSIVSPLAPGTLLWAGGRESCAGGGGGTGRLEMIPSSSPQPWGLTGEGLVTRYPFGGVCLFTFLPVLFTDSFFHIPDRRRISACWSLPPRPPVWGQDLWRLRPRGGTFQKGNAGHLSSFWNLCFPSLACAASPETAESPA